MDKYTFYGLGFDGQVLFAETITGSEADARHRVEQETRRFPVVELWSRSVLILRLRAPARFPTKD